MCTVRIGIRNSKPNRKRKHKHDRRCDWIGEIRGLGIGFSKWIVNVIERKTEKEHDSCLRSQS